MTAEGPATDPVAEAEADRRRAEVQRAKNEPLMVAREVLAAMSPGSPDARDQAMGLQGIGLALVDIAFTLRQIEGASPMTAEGPATVTPEER